MKLYSSPNSPFGARVEIAARAKGIAFEHLPLPAGGLRSEAFLAINPIAKIPVLVTATGGVIVESSVILEYLEDRFPQPSLLPSDAEERARSRMAACIMDRYVMDPVIRLFAQIARDTRDAHIVDYEVNRWRSGMAQVAHVLRDGLPSAEAPVSLADCVLAPSLHLGTRIAAMIGLDRDPMQDHPGLTAYYAAAKADPLIGPVLRQLTEEQERKDTKAGLPSLAHLH